jgi:hypothetical protein
MFDVLYDGLFIYSGKYDPGLDVNCVNPSVCRASFVGAVRVNEDAFEKRNFPSSDKNDTVSPVPAESVIADDNPHAE